MANAIENIGFFSVGDSTEQLSSLASMYSVSPKIDVPSFYYATGILLINGNGIFSDDDDTVILLTDAVYLEIIGGPSDPLPITHNVDVEFGVSASASFSGGKIYECEVTFSKTASFTPSYGKVYECEITLSATADVDFSTVFSPPPGTTPYELMTFADAELTDPHKYTLKATGGKPLRRAVYGVPAPGQGSHHPVGKRFAAIGKTFPGVYRGKLDPKWIGKTLKFKFVGFNVFGKGIQPVTDVAVYEYIPTGVALIGGYTQTPSVVLSQAPLTYSVAMAQSTEKFTSGTTVLYNSRSFAIPDPGGSPTTYYVTIYDPAQLGDNPGETNLTAYCETSKSRITQAGYIYLGSIIATHAGGVSGTAGGSLAAQLV
jgi:hypothetical protein